MGKKPVGTVQICLISQDRQLQEDVRQVVHEINSWLNESPNVAASELQGDCRPLQCQAQRYLRQQQGKGGPKQLVLHCFASLEAASIAQNDDTIAAECVYLDSRGLGLAANEDPFAQLLSVRPGLRFSPSSAVLFCAESCLAKWMLLLGGNRLIRTPLGQRDQRCADLLRLLLDHLEHAYFNRLLVRTTQPQTEPVAAARAVFDLMRARWGQGWDFHFFTGSMVAGFIDSMHDLAEGTDIGLYSGCNEHALAVGAMAGWQLYGRAYVIAVTSGMLDEARGTLDNLRRTGAPGIVICAESPETVWYAFQGTLNADSNGHAVIAARGLWSDFLREPGDLQSGLANAFDALDNRPGPTFVFASQSALESRTPVVVPLKQRTPAPSAISSITEVRLRERLNHAVAVLNHDPAPILWQCGRLSPTQRQRVLSIARKTGVALADSIVAPGSVPAWQDGMPVANYLGPLSMYGFSRRIYEFLEHRRCVPFEAQTQSIASNGDVSGLAHCANARSARETTETTPWLFFLKGKADQSATPYSEGKLRRSFRIAQVNRNPAHIAPFADLGLQMCLDDFLDYLEPRIAPDPLILRHRQSHLQRLQCAAEIMPSDCIETLPMTPNYFFQRLGQLVTELIRDEGYRYTGVYDVGRCSLSALRNIPRTDPGFSGWYGRALMGDGLMALPYLAVRNQRNVLAFIGDGARALVPDIEQRLAMCAASSPHAAGRNISLFYLNNGVLSMIQTYLDKRYALNGNRQVNVPQPGARAGLHEVAAQHYVSYHSIKSFCPETLRTALMARGQINFFDVMLSHNSDGDGLSLVSEETWSRQPVEQWT